MPKYIVRELSEVLYLYSVEAENETEAQRIVERGEVEPFGEDKTAFIWFKVGEDDDE
jgi:hypothetical protein